MLATCSGEDPASPQRATSSTGAAPREGSADAPKPEPRDAAPVVATPVAAGEVVRGRVVDRSGDPIPGARVAAFPVSIERAFDPAAERTVTTGADGAFEVAGLEGPAPYVVAAQAHGFAPRTRCGVRPPGDVTIVLGACATLEGRVLGPADAPVAGARVRVSGVLPGGARFESSSVSGDGGAYRVTNLPPIARPRTSPDTSISVLVLADGYAPLLVADVLDGGPRAVPDLAEGAAIRLDLHVVRGATITGRAVDATGRPVEGARVALMSYERPLGPGRFADQPRHLGTKTTAPDGSFRFPAVPAAGVHRPAILGEILPFGALVAVGPDGATGCVTVPVLRDGESHAVEIALVPVAWVTGRVVDESGAPVEGATVSARSEKGRLMPATFRSAGGIDVPCPHTTTGNDGRFRAAVPLTADAGTRLLIAAATAAAGMSPYRSAEASVAMPSQGDADVGDVVLHEESAFVHADVVVVDGDGRPVGGAWFRSRDEMHLPFTAWGWPATDAAGGSRLHWISQSKGEFPLGPAPREVVVTAPGFAAAVVQITFDIADGDAQRVVLVAGRHVAGRVRWSDGRPAADAWVLVADGAVPLDEAVPPASTRRTPPARHPATPGLVILGRAHAEADGSFRVEDVPGRPCHVVARVESPDGPGAGSTESSRVALTEVRPDAEGLVLVLPPRSEAQSVAAGSLDVRVIEDATSRPLAGAVAELFDGTTILYGAAAGEGRVRFDAVPRGDWTLRAGSARFGRAFVGGVRADDDASERVVRVARGATVRGRLEDVGGPGLVHLLADDAVVPWFWSPSALVSADGAFTLDGVPAGRYRVAVTRNSSAADAVACPDALEVRPGDAEVTFASRVSAARR